MSAKYNCPWCKKEITKAQYPEIQSFLLNFEVGTTSDIFGPSLEGYEIEDMCTPCSWKLGDELTKLGIEILPVDR